MYKLNNVQNVYKLMCKFKIYKLKISVNFVYVKV